MWEFIQFIRKSISSLIDMLDDYSFDIAGSSFSLLEIFLGFIFLSIVISVFWKGVRG